MKPKLGRKIMAILSSAALLIGSYPAAKLVTASAEDTTTTTVYFNDFESGDVSGFTKRGDDTDGTTITVATGDDAYSGTSYMSVTGRSKSWHGPSFSLDDLCTPGEQYTVSLAIKTPWYATVTLSMQYNDDSGTAHYTNLDSQVSQGDWVVFEDVKFAMTEYGGVSVYVECSDTGVSFCIDDFEIATAPVYEIEEDIVSLKDVYASYFKIGTAVTTDELAPQSTKNLILKHFNSVTLGNELKPDAILDEEACLEMAAAGDDTNPQVDISSARTILNFCRDNNISVRGHVLIWHSQTPDWFFRENYDEDGDWVTEEVMLQRMENYIKNVFEAVTTEYPTVDFYAWDVVNECFLNDGSCRTGGVQGDSGSEYSGWVQVFGDNSFIEPAFEYARKYAPEGCKLYYNDYNEYISGKTDAIYELAMDLKEKGLIDGIGMQSHLDVSFPTASAYKQALAKFASTGLDIQITELDITTSDTSEAGFEAQASLYSDILDACVEYADSISAVVFWGTTDDKSWRASRYPLLFNEDYTAKAAFYAIVDGLDTTTTTTTTTLTETEETTETTTETTALTETTTAEETTTQEELTTSEVTTLYIEDGSWVKRIALDPISMEAGDTLTVQLEVDVSVASSSVSSSVNAYINGSSTPVVLTMDDAYTLTYVAEEAVTSLELEFSMLLASDVSVVDYTVTAATETETTATAAATETTTEPTTETTASTDTTTQANDHTCYGDVNMDGSINMSDVILLEKACTGLVDLEGTAVFNADCDANGSVDGNDALILLRFQVQAIDQIPYTE